MHRTIQIFRNILQIYSSKCNENFFVQFRFLRLSLMWARCSEHDFRNVTQYILKDLTKSQKQKKTVCLLLAL